VKNNGAAVWVKFSYWVNIRTDWFWRLVDGCPYKLIDGSGRDSILKHPGCVRCLWRRAEP